MSGTANFAGEGVPGLTFKGSLAPLPVRDLVKYWPIHFADGARSWLDANVPAGLIGPMKVDANIPAGALDKDALPDNAMSISFHSAASRRSISSGYDALTEGVGAGTLTGDTFHGTVSEANLGTLPLSAGDVLIPNLHLHGTLGNIHAHVEGGMPEIMNLLNEDPLGYPKRFGIDPTKVGGRAKVDLDLRHSDVEGCQRRSTDAGRGRRKRPNCRCRWMASAARSPT